jgi:single-stranded-DNA-specific exonuclease
MPEQRQWHVPPDLDLPEQFVQAVRQYAAGLPGHYAARLLWQRGMRDLETLAGFLDPNLYQPASPFEFGEEMHWAIERLCQARQRSELVAIWGDFDADGITATAVLWDGLGQFFQPHQQLTYFIPNRLTESHGLSQAGLDRLAAQGYRLIITCDTGSTNLEQIEFAKQRGMDLIITDHHCLPAVRPPVTAIVNPRYLPADHALAHLSGVAVAYKLVEALYQTLPDVPDRPLSDLLDLVAIGLIADLVQLTGDCRYLAQRGIEQLQRHQKPEQSSRPGISRLLELCKRNGDRPSDISFGLGPRINAISRIHGDAHFCVELLTSQDKQRCRQLAEDTELANTRRKALQKDVMQQVTARLAQLDLSTTSVIVLSDPQWSVGILGLVASQVAQAYGRPTILLSTEEVPFQAVADRVLDDQIGNPIADQQFQSQETEVVEIIGEDAINPTRSPQRLARGSARSVNQIDLYQLLESQTHLLHRFGGHPYAAGLSLPIENIPLFAEAINQHLRQKQVEIGAETTTAIHTDLVVTIAELGKDLFRELKLLEPYGMGYAVPKLLIQNCWFENIWNRNIQDWRGRKVRYIKTEFDIWDESASLGFPGIWWDHYKDELPPGRCDAIAELDFNTYKKRYEIRLIAVRPAGQDQLTATSSVDWLLDWRCSARDAKQTGSPSALDASAESAILQLTDCPSSWDELQTWFRRAAKAQQKLAIAYPPPTAATPAEIWQHLVGIAKYLSRTEKPVTQTQLCQKLGIGDRALQMGFSSLSYLGFEIASSEQGFHITWQPSSCSGEADAEATRAIAQFQAMVQEEQFRRRYFYEVPLVTLQTIAAQSH